MDKNIINIAKSSDSFQKISNEILNFLVVDHCLSRYEFWSAVNLLHVMVVDS